MDHAAAHWYCGIARLKPLASTTSRPGVVEKTGESDRSGPAARTIFLPNLLL
jgi:hypothetical protein